MKITSAAKSADVHHYALLSFLFGMGMTFALYFEIRTWEDLNRAKEFQLRASNFASALQSGINNKTNELQFFQTWLRSEIISGNFENRDSFHIEFQENTHTLYAHNSSLLTVGIALKSREDGNTKIAKNSHSGAVSVTSSRRNAYLVTHVAPEKHKDIMAGLNLVADGDPKKTLESFYVDQFPAKKGEKVDNRVIAILSPLRHNELGGKTMVPFGYVFAVLDSQQMISKALEGHDAEGLEYHVYKPYSQYIPFSERVVVHGAHSHQSVVNVPDEYEKIKLGLYFNKVINVEKSRLIVNVYPSSLFFVSQESWHSTIGVALGSILSLFIAGFIGALSNRKLAVEQQVKAQQAQLAHDNRLKALGQMSAGVAHELNQPLTGIMSYAQNIADSLNGPDRDVVAAGMYTDKILAQARRVKNVMGRLKMFTRANDPPHELLKISYIVREAISLVQQEINQAGVTLKTDYAYRDRPIYGNELRLEQVIINLLQNALTAVRDIYEPAIYVTTQEVGKSGIVIEVADNGIGLPKGSEEQVFEPFFTTSKPNEGTGLGLAICHQIIKEHGGDLTAANRQGGGAVFTINLKSAK